MIEKVVRKSCLSDFSEPQENLSYWLTKTPEERVSAVEYLRRQIHGSSAGFQRTARAFKRSHKS